MPFITMPRTISQATSKPKRSSQTTLPDSSMPELFCKILSLFLLEDSNYFINETPTGCLFLFTHTFYPNYSTVDFTKTFFFSRKFRNRLHRNISKSEKVVNWKYLGIFFPSLAFRRVPKTFESFKRTKIR